jgi:hypothetical protein
VANKIRVFIGSSREALIVALGVKAVLESFAEVRIWNEDLFRPGQYTLDELLHFTTDFDFAVFVWSGDDEGVIRGQSFFMPRDNVVLEAGIFYGALGKDRVFLIAPREPKLKTPTDLLGLSLSFYERPSDENYRSAVQTATDAIGRLMKKRGRASRKSLSSIACHGTKFDVPNRTAFWDGLLHNAERRFYLVGNSNKSWVNKSDRQKVDLSKSIYRIIKQGGKVKIISSAESAVVESHRIFFRKYFRTCLDEDKGDCKEKAMKFVAENLIYGFHRHSNYGAVVSDDRLILLPTMNTAQFRAESLVLEVQNPESEQFRNYLSDLDRLFSSEECTRVDVIDLIS